MELKLPSAVYHISKEYGEERIYSTLNMKTIYFLLDFLLRETKSVLICASKLLAYPFFI